jgi:hypothetical protein
MVKRTSIFALFLLAALYLVFADTGPSSASFSDGSDGTFHAKGDIVLQVPEVGILNFSSFIVDPGATVTLRGHEHIPSSCQQPNKLLSTGP